jgi:hypothetical protein
MANSPRMILRVRAHALAWTLILLVALAAPGATLRANGEASSGSTSVMFQSIYVARNRGRTNAAMAQAQGRSLVAGLVMRNRLPSLISS